MRRRLRFKRARDSVSSMAKNTAATILVADDDPEILTLVSVRLAKRGYNVLEASDGEHAIKVAREKRPDLVVLDVMMPFKNGWEVAKELRDDPELTDIGIVMLTAIGERINTLTSPLYGADAFLDKPFDFKDLDSAVEQTLLKRRGK